jgi:aryl-alcohol dehydrogenase-like predicted oxidoreductase
MRTVALAGTTLSGSRLGFGLSGLHHVLRSKDRQDLLSCAVDHGIRYFDTSPFYGHGLAERELGLFATARRNQILIATKVGLQANPWLNRFPALMYPRLGVNAALRRLTKRDSFIVPRTYDYSGRHVVASVHHSLRALRTDRVEILYLHDPTLARLTEPDRLIDTLRGLQSAGKVRYFGLTGEVSNCMDILRHHPELGSLLQVDATAGSAPLDLLNAASIPFHGSYGHFRGASASVPQSLAAAIRTNRHGVILFSTRRAERVGAMVRLLSSMERD